MNIPIRILLDTNSYGLLAEEASPELFSKIESSGNVVIYGLSIVRQELRDTPKGATRNGAKLRNLLLNYYDKLTKGRNLPLTRLVEVLGQEYLNNYSGGISKRKLSTDFLIVACASLNRLDVLVSDDNHSMLSRSAIESYNKVNAQNGLKTPKFYSLRQFGKLL